MQQITAKKIGGEVDPLGIVQEIQISLCEQGGYAQPRICPREWDAQINWDIVIQTYHLIAPRRRD